MNDNRWVEDRMRSLDVNVSWQPNPASALARLKARRLERQLRGRRPWIWAVSGVSLVALAIIALPSRGTCAQRVLGFGCVNPALAGHFPAEKPKAVPAEPSPKPTVAVARVAMASVKIAAAPPLIRNYKESGSPDAPIACEIYSDYECPACAAFFEQTLPLLVEKYVKTGRMKLLHRDIPLPQHPYAKLAAQYANAAGELGYYGAVVAQLFRAQSVWGQSGRVGDAVAQVIPAEAMRKLRETLMNDKASDVSMSDDLKMAERDVLNQTPTLVFVYSGHREKVAPVGSFAILQSYLDQLPVK